MEEIKLACQTAQRPVPPELLKRVDAKVADYERGLREVAAKRAQEETARRQEAERRGDKLWRRVGALLKGTFGFTSQELIQFGFNPRPVQTGPRKRRVA